MRFERRSMSGHTAREVLRLLRGLAAALLVSLVRTLKGTMMTCRAMKPGQLNLGPRGRQERTTCSAVSKTGGACRASPLVSSISRRSRETYELSHLCVSVVRYQNQKAKCNRRKQ
jgi:hypothetical protein